MAVYGYARVSTQEQTEGSSLKSQERRVRAAAEFLGESLTMLFIDGGISGGVPLEDRPNGAVLINSLEVGDTVIVSKLDRMFRSAADALTWLERFKAEGIKLIMCDMGMEPVTENGVSKMLFTILAAMAEFEKDRINERTSEGRKAKTSAGGWMGGKPPFGFMIEGSGKTARCVPDPALAFALDDLKRCWTTGTSLRGAVKYLSGKGVRVSFNQVHRVYQQFDHDSTEENKRSDARDAAESLSLEEPVSR